ncbi:MAG: PEGA domain-containing protein [Myxococcales bacterium]|nr:PEGA domain-containing protein [Myxococcota bacterium]MDW8280147.1 PEGA domain-containing protein [Myxococcales bacterium]
MEPPPAGAAPADDSSPAAEPKRTRGGPRKLRVTVLPLPQPGVREEVVVSILRALSGSLQGNERLDMRDLESRLSDFAQEVPMDQIELARSTYAKGMAALQQLDPGAAALHLQEAVDLLVVVLPYVRKQELADAMMALAVAHALRGNRRASNATLVRLLTWRSDYPFDPERHPPQLAAPLEEARRAVSRLARGALRIETDPPGAQAFVDGTYVGVTPLEVSDLLVGEHYLTFRKLGFRKGVRVAQVSARSRQVVQARLQPLDKYLLVKQTMDRLAGKLGAARLDPVADTLKETLYLDHAVFLRIGPPLGNTLPLAAFLYDLRTRMLLAHTEVRLDPAGQREELMEQVAARLYAAVDYDHMLKPPPEPPPSPVAVRRPLYRRWWFLTALGAIAASVTAVGLGVGLTRSAGCPADHVCTGAIQY